MRHMPRGTIDSCHSSRASGSASSMRRQRRDLALDPCERKTEADVHPDAE
jgi:hypothetical protein